VANWEVVMRAAAPHPDHPGGVVVSLTDGETVSTFARVGWRRRDSRHPLRTFKRQLRSAIARAAAEAERLNASGERIFAGAADPEAGDG
jgi:hypothetical protein